MTSDNTTPDLKPCPFCGGEYSIGDDYRPVVYFTKPVNGVEYRYCECHDCGIRTADCDTELDAIEAWNTRAEMPQPVTDALDPDMPADQLRLHMGELTPNEVLVARAAIRWANTRNVQPVTDAERQQALDYADGMIERLKSEGVRLSDGGQYGLKVWETIRRALSAPAPQTVDINDLAQFIRRIDGNNSLGAGALSEAIASEYDLIKKVK